MGIVKASLEILGIGIGVKKVVLLRSATHVCHSVVTESRVASTFYTWLLVWGDMRRLERTVEPGMEWKRRSSLEFKSCFTELMRQGLHPRTSEALNFTAW